MFALLAFAITSAAQFIGLPVDTPTKPSFTWLNDLTTGVWHPANGTIGILTTGIERMRISPSGNVGIGVTSPVSKLQVDGGLQIGADTATCDAGKEGAIRYNFTSKKMEYCDATSWKVISNPSSQPKIKVFYAGRSSPWGGQVARSWTVPTTGDYTFYAFGAGGGGGAQDGSYTCTGGGGGAALKWTKSLVAGDSVSMMIGVGGQPVSIPWTTATAGGSTTLTIGGTTVTAGGGGPGANNGVVGIGGTAVGGDLNVSGSNAVGDYGGSSGFFPEFEAGQGGRIGASGNVATNRAPGTSEIGAGATVGGAYSQAGSWYFTQGASGANGAVFVIY